jgi:hypothetical protein
MISNERLFMLSSTPTHPTLPPSPQLTGEASTLSLVNNSAVDSLLAP